MSVETAEYSDETVDEREAREAEFEYLNDLDDISMDTVNMICDKLLVVIDEFSGIPLYPYQKQIARRIVESLVVGDGATITALQSRQSGKSEVVANTIATCMVMLPLLSKVFPSLLDKFSRGFWVGSFAPTDDQSEIVYSRIVSRLTSGHALEFFADPDIQQKVWKGHGKTMHMTNGSLIRRQTAHPRSNIEGRTYHLMLVDECFPEGTPVLTSEGWVDIKEIVETGHSKDWVVATQDGRDVGWAYVTRGFKTRRNTELVRVVHEHGTLYSTANHPFMVGGEKVPAIHLTPGTELSLVSRTSNRPEDGDAHLFELPPRAFKERDAVGSNEKENVLYVEEDGASTTSPWGQWNRNDETPESVTERLGTGVDTRVCSPMWSRKPDQRVSDTLQTGLSARNVDDRSRDRRILSRDIEEAGIGLSEGTVSFVSRVVSVSVLEQGSTEFDQFSDGADYVYTLEVASDSHTYFAAGVAVGNCQDVEARVINKCVVEGTSVWTPEGPAPIEDVVKNRRDILTYDGALYRDLPGELEGVVPATPSDWIDNGEKPVWKITTSTGRVLEATEDHRWLIRNREGNRQVKIRMTKELTVGDTLPLTRDAFYFGTRGNRDQGYYLGQILGDGNMTGTSVKWCGFADRSMTEMARIAETMGDRISVWHVQEASGLHEVGLVGGGSLALVRQEGLWGLKGKDKALQRADYSPDFYKGFIEGLLDSDGSVTGTRVTVATISEQMMRQFQEALLRLGINSHLYTRSNTGGFGVVTQQPLWVVDVKARDDVLTLRSLVTLFAQDKDERLTALATKVSSKKSRRASSDPRRGYPSGVIFDAIKSIEPSGVKRTYCVTVQPTHTVIWDGVVGLNSIGPMGASTNATMVFIGTPNYTKGAFYNTIQLNKRQASKRGARQNHFQFDWKEVSKYNRNYEKFVRKEMLRIGEDSDEFTLAYKCLFLLDKGMYTTPEKIDRLMDKSMEIVHAWHRTPVLVGIDPARKQDSTIVTVIWVDWDHPDEFGLYDHRILNWLDLSNLDWEQQYMAIVEFLANYNVMAIGVDEGGLGDPVIQRLRVLMPHTEIIGVQSDRSTQSKRWKHLKTLLDREKIGFPGHAKTRRLKIWKRFSQQMEDLEIKFEGPYVMAAAPKAADAHDDYCVNSSSEIMVN